LRRAHRRTYSKNLLGGVEGGMDALPHKMETIGASLVVQFLEFLRELHERIVSLDQICPVDFVLMDDTDAKDEFAKVGPILLREDTVE
jgi:hypothetical protein